MSKRVSNKKGQPSGNRSWRGNRHNNYMRMIMLARSTDMAEDMASMVEQFAISAKTTISKLVPKGASKYLKSLVRQRT